MKILENKKTGISLVALIVTIIVLIILTGAVIVTFMEGGIIDRAKDAVARNDLATLKEVYSLKYNKKKIDVDIGETEGIAELDALKEATDELKLKGFSYADGTVTYTGDNKYISEWLDSEFIYKSLAEGGYYFTKIDGKTYMTGLKVGDNWETAGDILSKLGEGYAIYDNNGTQVTDSSAQVTTGYVIKQGDTEYATVVVKSDVAIGSGINLTDGNTIDSIINGGNYIKAQLLASDINGDGIVSLDDSKLVFALMLGNKFYDKSEIQKSGIKQNITIQNEYIYTWHETKNDIKALLVEKGINMSGDKIIVAGGTTFAQLVTSIESIIPLERTDFYDSNEDDVSDASTLIEDGSWIDVYTSAAKIDGEYYLRQTLELEIGLE